MNLFAPTTKLKVEAYLEVCGMVTPERVIPKIEEALASAFGWRCEDKAFVGEIRVRTYTPEEEQE